MSWDEIVAAYPDRWVGLIDVDWEDESNVKSAVVLYTERSADELALMQLHQDNLYSAYTTPDNLGPHSGKGEFRRVWRIGIRQTVSNPILSVG